jgi:hypothetical protein
MGDTEKASQTHARYLQAFPGTIAGQAITQGKNLSDK